MRQELFSQACIAGWKKGPLFCCAGRHLQTTSSLPMQPRRCSCGFTRAPGEDNRDVHSRVASQED